MPCHAGRITGMIDGVKLAAIVLAAGAGRRFGGNKLLAPYRGRPLIEHSLLAADAAPVEDVIVVVGAEAGRVIAAVHDCPAAHPRRIVCAENWDEGMAASLRAGGAALTTDTDGAFVLLGDMPAIPHVIFAPLAAALAGGAEAAAPVCAGVRGHPVLLGKVLLTQVAALRGDHGARELLAAATLVPTSDRGVLFDVDFRADIASFGDDAAE